MPTVQESPVRVIGPYTVVQQETDEWVVYYLESQEDIDSWHHLLTVMPDLGQAHIDEEHSYEFNGDILHVQLWVS